MVSHLSIIGVFIFDIALDENSRKLAPYISDKFLIFGHILARQIYTNMLLGKKLRELREDRGMLQRQVAALLEIDGGLYSKIERGERKAKRGQITSIAKIFNTNEDELLTLWLADQIEEAVGDEGKNIAREAIDTYCNCKLM